MLGTSIDKGRVLHGGVSHLHRVLVFVLNRRLAILGTTRLAIHDLLLVLVVEAGVRVQRLPVGRLILVAWCLLVDHVHV